MIKKHKRFFILLGLLVILTGCGGDRTDIGKLSFITAIGIDKLENTEESGIKITYLLSNPEENSPKSAGKEPPKGVLTFISNDINSARDTASVAISKKISYDTLRYVFVSEEFAQDKKFLKLMYDFTKDPNIRRDTKLIITKEEASKFLSSLNPPFETKPYEHLQLITHNLSGMIPRSDLLTYYRITELGQNLFLAAYASMEKPEEPSPQQDEDNFKAGELYLETQGTTPVYAGSAVFKNGKMIGTLTAEETRLTYMMDNTMTAEQINISFVDPNNETNRIAMKLQPVKKADIHVNVKKEIPEVHVQAYAVAEVLSDESMTNYSDNKDKQDQLKKSMESQLKMRSEELINRTQEEFKGGVFNWANSVRRKFKTIPEFENYNWMDKYPEMKITVDYKVSFRRFGRQPRLPDYKEIER